MRAAATALLLVVAMLGGCATLPPPPSDLPPESALPAGDGGVLDTLIAPDVEAHPGQSGFHLVSDGVSAFVLRGLSARTAVRSLDLQYYIWHDDLTGRLLAAEVLAAADRGVRVRLLLDDVDARAKNDILVALSAHPRIDVRLFNPFASRKGSLALATEAIGSFARINRRMHNKSWIADGRLALVGGRNIGDEYFGASEAVNFSDLDVAMAGPVVAATSAAFDRYWNSPLVWPIERVNPAADSAAALEALRRRAAELATSARDAPWVVAMRAQDPRAGAGASLAAMHWTADWKLLVDDPDKSDPDRPPQEASAVLAGLTAALAGARREADFISPYFVPGENGTARLRDVASSGRRVRILTNSLAANDVAAVHAGYSRYRGALVDGGVQLWELKPEREATEMSLFGSSGASLHTKAALFDGEVAFVGSFNLDPRSVALNSEQGVLVRDPAIAAGLAALFEAMVAPTAAWRVDRGPDGELRWTDDRGQLTREPEVGVGRRAAVFLARILPIEPLL